MRTYKRDRRGRFARSNTKRAKSAVRSASRNRAVRVGAVAAVYAVGLTSVPASAAAIGVYAGAAAYAGTKAVKRRRQGR